MNQVGETAIKPKTSQANWTIVQAQQPPLTLLVTMVFTFLRTIGMYPSNLVFDSEKAEFVHRSGSKIRKALSTTLAVATILQSVGLSQHYVLCKPMNATSLVLVRMVGVGGVAVAISFYRVLLTKGNHVEEMLNLIHHESRKLEQKSSEFLGSRQARLLSAALIATSAIVCLFQTMVNLLRDEGSAPLKHPWVFCRTAVDTEVGIVGALLGYNLTQYDPPDWLTYAAGGIAVSVDWWVGMCWSCAILVSMAWAVLFVLLFQQAFSNMRNQSPDRMLDIIQSFNAIVRIIDKYNGTFSWVTLTSVTTFCLFVSAGISSALTEWDAFTFTLVVFPVAWFSLQLVASAHVHHLASQITKIIRQKFHSDGIQRGDFLCEGNESNVATGLMLILHDIKAGNVGFKGYGFFTCSYDFIASIIGIIATYTIVMYQFSVSI